MNLYFITFISGLTAVLTPIVFPYLIITSSLFEKLGDSDKQYKTNIFLYGLLTIIVYLFVISPLLTTKYINELIFSSDFIFLIHSAQIIFLIWFLSTFVKNFQIVNKGLWKQFFRFFGILVFSIKLAFGSLSATGPIIGSILISNSINQDTSNINGILFAFSFGLVLPFIIILWFFVKKYSKLKLKKWWNILQLIFAGILFLGSFIQLISLI